MRAPAVLLVGVVLLLLAPEAVAVEGLKAAQPGVRIEKMYDGLDQPVDFAFAPDGALYYVEFMTGNLRRVAPGASTPDPEPLWTAPGLQTGGERGLVGLALDPRFDETGAAFVYYQHNESGTVTSRLSRIVEGEESILLGDLKSGLLHNSGRILFLPDGTMLVSVGDAVVDTAGRHAARHAHDETDLNGKVLRLNADGSAAAGNPWGNEVWTKGHRNVYGLAVSPEGVVLATENGPELGDEANLLEAGKDYGWPTCAGPCEEPRPDLVDPILSYTPTIAPTGASWHEGSFYFGDFNTGRLRRVVPQENGSYAEERVLQLDKPRILDLEAWGGTLWFSTWDSVWRIHLPGDRPVGDEAPPRDEAPLPTTATSPTIPSPTPGADAPPGEVHADLGRPDDAAAIPGPGAGLALLAVLAALGCASRSPRERGQGKT